MLGVAIGTTNQPHADESGDMLASSRVPDVDVYADVTALKLSHVFRTELSSLEATETTIPLIQVLKRAYNVFPTCPIWWWLQKTKLYDTYTSEDGSLGLDGSGRSLTSSIKNQEMHVFWVKRVFIMYSTKLKQ